LSTACKKANVNKETVTLVCQSSMFEIDAQKNKKLFWGQKNYHIR